MGRHFLPSDEFVGFLTASQDRLRAYLLACVGSYNDANDVLQKTNIVLLKKAKEFDGEQEFLAWALTVAKYEVLAHIRTCQRDRLTFNPDIALLMSEESLAEANSIPERQLALKACLASVPESRLVFLRLRYGRDLTLKQIAEETNRSVGAVKVMLVRLRGALRECITRKLSVSSLKPSPP